MKKMISLLLILSNAFTIFANSSDYDESLHAAEKESDLTHIVKMLAVDMKVDALWEQVDETGYYVIYILKTQKPFTQDLKEMINLVQKEVTWFTMEVVNQENQPD
jgi:hypothetical protein